MKQPDQGGSYIRQPDGSLKRVEVETPPADTLPDVPTEAAPPAGRRGNKAKD